MKMGEERRRPREKVGALGFIGGRSRCRAIGKFKPPGQRRAGAKGRGRLRRSKGGEENAAAGRKRKGTPEEMGKSL